MSERRRKKSLRFLKETSDRSGFDNWHRTDEGSFTKEWQSIKQNGLTLEPEEFDMPPPSNKPLGGADISGEPRVNSDSTDVPSEFVPQVQYLTATSTISVPNNALPILISGSNSTVTLLSDAEKIANGTFDGVDGWSGGSGGGAWLITGGKAYKDNDGTDTLSQGVENMLSPLVEGETYTLTGTIGDMSVVYVLTFEIGGTSTTVTGEGGFSYTFTCVTASNSLSFSSTNTSRFSLDNISLKLYTPNPKIAAGQSNQIIALECVGSAVTLTHGNGVYLSAQKTFNMTSGAIITLVYNSTTSLWYETSRCHELQSLGGL